MAEKIGCSIVGWLISELKSYGLSQIQLWCNFKDDVDYLKRNVSENEAVLPDAEERSLTSKRVEDFLAELKDALYDAEDLLEDVHIEARRKDQMSGNMLTKEVRVFFSSSNQFAYSLKMGREIKAITARFTSIQIESDKLELKPRDHPVHAETPLMAERRQQTHSFVLKDEIIGREDDKAALLQLLLDTEFQNEETVLILPIVGIGGLGKTALAQFVSNHEWVKAHFKPILWVCISDVFDLKTIVANIISSDTKDEPNPNLQMDQLQKQLRDKIDGKKYFLVLDDVWEEEKEHWFRLKKLLMGGARGSRIIVTTRSHTVAKNTNNCEPYILKGLSDDDAWSLFKKIAFEQRSADSTNPAFLKIGKQILERCSGVPLVIRTIASTLSSKKTETQWRAFKDSVLFTISQKDGKIIPILKLSYDHLPSHLKHCFAYCRLYPKDHEINVQTLVQLWIAQGFVKKSNPSQSLEENGLECFRDLVERSFFQEVQEDEGWGMTCKMHDLMHDLAESVAGRESSILDSNSSISEVDRNCRHISMNLSLFPLFKGKKLRTLLQVPNKRDRNMDEAIWDLIISNCRYLRVLELDQLNFDTVLLHSIYKLKHLRYLDFSNNHDLKILPKSICKMQNLQVLKLEGCMNLEELPKKIEKLVNLTHLPFAGCVSLTHMPHGIGKLTSLETLSLFVVDKAGSHDNAADLSELSGLNNLRGELTLTNLGFVKNAKEEFRAANLKEKQHLQSLALQWSGAPYGDDEDDEDDEEKSLEDLQPHPYLKKLVVEGWRGNAKFPRWISSLTDLTAIEIWYCSKFKHLTSFSQLPRLQKLFIVELTELEYMEDSEAGGGGESESFFPSLTSLTLRQCPNLKSWWRKRSFDNNNNGTTVIGTSTMAFPCLSRLEIRDCPLISMPLYPSLDDELWLENTSSRPLKQTMQMNIAPSTSSLPLSKLKSFGVENIEELDPDILDECTQSQKSLSGCLQQLTSLKSLTIIDWKELDLEGMQWETLKNLSHLEISNIPGLEYMEDSDPSGGQRGSESFFPSLTYLTLRQCPNMKSWWRKRPIDDQNSNGSGTEIQASTIAFPCLSGLCIEYCPLTSMPLYPSLEDELTLINTSSRPLKQIMQMNIAASTSSLPLSKLKSLEVENIEELVDPDILDECRQDKFLSGWLHQLTSLERLSISDCKELDLECMPWELLKNLSYLKIHNIPQLLSLPLSLQHLTNLKSLHLNSLPNLTSLPDEMTCLTNLECLNIDEIPHLEERCQEDIGADWHKIAHIPSIGVNGTWLLRQQ